MRILGLSLVYITGVTFILVGLSACSRSKTGNFPNPNTTQTVKTETPVFPGPNIEEELERESLAFNEAINDLSVIMDSKVDAAAIAAADIIVMQTLRTEIIAAKATLRFEIFVAKQALCLEMNGDFNEDTGLCTPPTPPPPAPVVRYDTGKIVGTYPAGITRDITVDFEVKAAICAASQIGRFGNWGHLYCNTEIIPPNVVRFRITCSNAAPCKTYNYNYLIAGEED